CASSVRGSSRASCRRSRTSGSGARRSAVPMPTWASSGSRTSTPTSSRDRTSGWRSSSTRGVHPYSLTVRRRWRTRSRMPIHRPLRAIVLYGGWLLLVNPREQQLAAPLSSWKKVHEYDTAYDCQRKREEEVQAALDKDAKKGGQTTASEAEL